MGEFFTSLSGALSSFFLNPAIFIPGAALVASPIVIHLLNRLRFRKIRFAAMEFLLQSQKRNKRRVLLEQLLLLLMRVLMVLLIAALVARLVLDPGQFALLQGEKNHHLVLLDDSISMQDRWGETTAFDEAKSIVRKLVQEGARRPGTQKLTVLLLSNPDEPFVNGEELNEQFLVKFSEDVDLLKCTHQSFSLLDGIEAARRQLDEPAVSRTLHIISDFRESEWSGATALSKAIDSFESTDIAVNLVRAVTETHPNVALVDLRGDLQSAAVNVPLPLTATVRNYSATQSGDRTLRILKDGTPLPFTKTIDSIAPGQTVTKTFEVTFQTPGRHSVRAELDSDALEEDNDRSLVVDLLAANPVLIVDGSRDGEEAELVRDALAADPSITGIAPLIQKPEVLRRGDLGKYRCIIAIDVASLPADAILPLTNYVRDGGGLVWYLGQQTDPNFYNKQLYSEEGGIFPVRLGPAWEDLPRTTDVNPGPDIVFTDHPLFTVFAGDDNPYVATVHVDRYFPLANDFPRRDADRNDGVKTIASLRNRRSLMFEHQFGRGRVVTCLTSAGLKWNDWSANPSFVIMQLELLRYLAKPFQKIETEIVGSPIEIAVSASGYSEEVEIASPSGRVSRLKMVPREVKESESDSSTVLLEEEYNETDEPGVYRITLYDQDQTPVEREVAFNAPVAESDLEIISDEDLDTRIDALDVQSTGTVTLQTAENLDWIRQRDSQQEVRLSLIFVLLAVMMIEQFLAYRLSYHSRRAGALA